MLDGRLFRTAVLLLVLVAPAATAANPSPNLDAAFSMGGQDITGLGVDPTGQFAMVGVAFDSAKLTGGLLPGSSTHRDLYQCDFGPVERPRSGSGCRGINQANSVSGAPNAPQLVAATSFDVTGGRTAAFAVAGPGPYVSLWTNTGDAASWTRQVEGTNVQALNVTLSRDSSRVVYAVGPATTGAGRIEVRFGSNGTLAWDLPVTGLNGGSVRPTALDYARAGATLAVGTNTGGVLLFNPESERPSGTPAGISQATGVNAVALSGNGEHVVAAADNGVFYAKIGRTGAKPVLATQVYSRGFGTSVQDVAIALDGSRFAAAVGNDIRFYRTINTSDLAEPIGEAYNVGQRVVDMDYDEKGRMLVAIAGNTVYGFGPSKTTPVFSFDATQTAFGALDAPLRSVSVSDDGQRIIVAGKTKVMAYSSVVRVNATLASVSGATTMSPTQTLELQLNVRNSGSIPDNYTFVVLPPVGWPAASAESLSLDPEQSGTVRFNVTAPAGSQPGSYGVEVRVRSQVADDLAARRNQPSGYVAGPAFNITIPRSVVLKVEAPDDRVLLRQGGEQTLSITLRNEGNAEGVVNLSARQELTRGAAWDVRFTPEQVRVPASGSAQVSMVVTAPSDAGSGDRNLITVRAREGETVEATDIVTAYVDAQFGAELRVSNATLEFYPGQFRTITLTVSNTGNTQDTFNLSAAVTPAALANDWRVTIETPQVTVERGQSKAVAVTIKPAVAEARDASLTLSAISQLAPDNEETNIIVNLMAIPRPPTDENEDSRLIPAPAVGLVLLGVAALALARRRGGVE